MEIRGAAIAPVSISDLAVSHATRRVLDGISIELAHGAMCAVVGPSGAGKTTLLRAIAGLVPYEGTVRVGNADVRNRRVHQRGTSMLFQNPRLFENMSVLDNVAYAARLRRVPRTIRRAQARQLLAEVGLGGAGDVRPHTLSGGERQRVALARALTASPDVLLLDEPLNSVDGPLRIELRSLVANLCGARSLTTFIVTHDVDDALAIADRVAIVIDGALAQCGTPADIVHRPDSAAVALLAGNPNNVTRDGVSMTVRPERIRTRTGGQAMRVTGVQRHLTHDVLCLASPWGDLHAHLPPGDAPRPGCTIAVDIDESAWWTFPDQRGRTGHDRDL